MLFRLCFGLRPFCVVPKSPFIRVGWTGAWVNAATYVASYEELLALAVQRRVASYGELLVLAVHAATGR